VIISLLIFYAIMNIYVIWDLRREGHKLMVIPFLAVLVALALAAHWLTPHQ
jgi:cytochrome c oxidase assembly factor CtaG